MKFRILLISVVVSSVLYGAEQEIYYQNLVSEANAQYKAGDYDSAKALYNQVVQNGLISADLFYNLGNTHYRQGNISAAILFYERALRLKPSDDDIQYNLDIAERFVTDKIEPIEPFIPLKWWNDLARSMSADQWANLFLMLLLVSSAFGVLFFVGRQKEMKQIGFFGGGAGFIIAGIILSLAFSSDRHFNRKEAIVFSSSVNVKSEPGFNATDQFVVHEGLKVEVIEEDGDWSRINLADGNSGWLMTSSIEVI